MKRLFAVFVCLLGLASGANATVTIEIDAGLLRGAGSAGSAPIIPQGALLQLIASPSGLAAGLTPPTATSFTSGDNIVVASFAMNYGGGPTGETDNVITFTLQNTASPSSPLLFDQGDPLLLRWYPTLMAANNPSSPGANVAYGQFRTDGTTDGTSAYVTPANSNSSAVLIFSTVDDGGTSPNSFGVASNTTPAPEPSSYALLGGALLGLLGVQRFNRRVKV